jgi:hypothetical protein
MAGSLARVVLEPAATLEEGSAALNVTQQALAYITQSGLPLPSVSITQYRGEMPPDITMLDDGTLGQLLNETGQWCSFLDFQLAQADANREDAKANLTFVKARIRIAIKNTEEGKKYTVQDKNDIMDTDPRVVAAQSRSLYCEAVYQLTKSIRDRAQRSWETVSRRITQRGQEVERMRRESNVAGIPATGRTFNRR